MPLRQTAAADMENAIKEMKSQGVHSYILDLRNNPVTFILIFFGRNFYSISFPKVKILIADFPALII